MEYVCLIIILIVTIVILKIGLNIRIKDLKKIKQMAYSEDNNKLTKDFPTNKQICREILEMLNNSEVTIEDTQDEKSKTSLYLVMQNKIIIANIDKTFTRIQTIAHECIHSVQDKVMLKFNFAISNINMIFFLQFIFFVVRNSLEIDAMTRAENLSKEYISQENILSKENEERLMSKYKELNKIGIKTYTFMLTIKMIIKPLLYCVIALFK